MRAIEAVVFDIGGVVQESPLHATARYECDHGLESFCAPFFGYSPSGRLPPLLQWAP